MVFPQIYSEDRDFLFGLTALSSFSLWRPVSNCHCSTPNRDLSLFLYIPRLYCLWVGHTFRANPSTLRVASLKPERKLKVMS